MKTAIIFSLFLLVAGVVAAFTYIYRASTDSLLQAYVSKITTCENILSEEDCYSRDFCEGVYMNDQDNPGKTTFNKCVRVPAERLQAMESEEVFCTQTGGQWSRTYKGTFCLCEFAGVNKVFNPKRGCIDK